MKWPLKILAVLGVLIVLILDAFAASPLLHEAICHHNHCIEISDEGANSGTHSQDHSHSDSGIGGCVITLFAAGQIAPFLFVIFHIQRAVFRFSWKTVSERSIAWQQIWIWPQKTGPPVIM